MGKELFAIQGSALIFVAFLFLGWYVDFMVPIKPTKMLQNQLNQLD